MILMGLIGLSFALVPNSTKHWVQTRPSSPGLIDLIGQSGLSRDDSKTVMRLVRRHMSDAAFTMQDEMMNTSCSESSTVFFDPHDKWSADLNVSQSAFLESMFGVMTGYCIENANVSDVFETFMSKSFRLAVMPRLTQYELGSDSICIEADGIRGIVKKAAFCLDYHKRRSKDVIVVHTLLKSSRDPEFHQAMYHREAVLIFVQKAGGVSVRRLILTRANELNAVSKAFLKQTAVGSQPKIKSILIEFLAHE